MPSRKHSIATWLTALLILLSGCGGGGGSSPAAAPPAISGSVSGTITAATNSFIDSDVNDPNVAPVYNNDADHPQNLQNPFTVGGYASVPSDQLDYYNVDLTKGQVISLSISDHSVVNNLNLLLKDPDPASDATLILSNNGTSLETITVHADGNYNIVVQAVSGSSKYVMTISAASSSEALLSLHIEDDFVPGEMIVRFKEADSGISLNHKLSSSAKALGLSERAKKHGRPLKIDMKNSERRQSIMKALGVKRNKRRAPALTPAEEKKHLKRDTINAIRALRRRPDIASADLNYIRRLNIVPNDQHYPNQWHYPLINLPQAWDIAANTVADTSGIIVAVVDTGVFMTHPDLAANLLDTGYDFISSASRAFDDHEFDPNPEDEIDPNPNDPGDSLSAFHGTHVAGTIAALSNNTIGVAGVTWNGINGTSKILPVRVLGLGGVGTSYDVIQGVRYAAGLSNDSGIILNEDQRADIINLSLSGPGFSQLEQDTYTEAARDNGVICIAAAGNDDTNAFGYPASYDNVISVSAVDLNMEKAFYSNYGSSIDVAAPGGDNYADNNGDGYGDGVLSTSVEYISNEPIYAFKNGTSMAAPHVAGVVALMKAVYPNLLPKHFFDASFKDNVLKTGQITYDLAGNGSAIRDDTFGYGLIDALKALEAANTLAIGGELPPVLVVSPQSLNFAPDQNNLPLTTNKGGGGTLQIISVTKTAPWLTVTPDPNDIDANGIGTYNVAIDRTGLNEANYTTTISFETDTAGTIEVPVTMQVSSSVVGGYDAGYHYILLIDPDTNNTLHALNATSNGGVYQFNFTGIEADEYYVVAGTDSDNDNFICGPGEACGGYPTINQLTPVSVNNDTITGIDFITGFSVNFSSAASSAAHIPEEGFAIEPRQKTIDASGR